MFLKREQAPRFGKNLIESREMAEELASADALKMTSQLRHEDPR